jgi:hypothetical protein
VRFEITDAFYGVVYREEEPDCFEFCGKTVSVSAIVPRGPITEAAGKGDYSRLAGAALLLRDWSGAFEEPFLLLPDGTRARIIGGTMAVQEAHALAPGLGEHDAAGQLSATLELALEAAAGGRRHRGRLELAFQTA